MFVAPKSQTSILSFVLTLERKRTDTEAPASPYGPVPLSAHSIAHGSSRPASASQRSGTKPSHGREALMLMRASEWSCRFSPLIPRQRM